MLMFNYFAVLISQTINQPYEIQQTYVLYHIVLKYHVFLIFYECSQVNDFDLIKIFIE